MGIIREWQQMQLIFGTDELKAIRKDLEFIKTHMFDPDTIMMIEEKKRFEEAFQELEEGKTTSLSILKRRIKLLI